MATIISAENVSFHYPAEYSESGEVQSEPVQVLEGIDLKVKKGEFLAVLGHNGCGKSTLAKHFNAIYQH